MYAIIKTGGKQYKVQEKEAIYVEKLDVEEGKKVTFDEVIMVVDGTKSSIGAPFVKGATVSGKVEKQGKERKVVTYKYKPKKHSHTKTGHRQPYTRVMIDSIKNA
ncbi:50S ribosomal protein L21 [Companilactobacillus sp. RD055328]|uniref:50S ribosomal protein L21 n=1 Tax=Companilactobacillus sp. RD055328 TaxID=2916634 RepID=UPI001FC86D5C|nr:50S ribosomal protein L21 [Companilactobacillus sp. RD055328]GKQ42547.1 50S ribosomal protein L21 [Companilactobacillus sp. RD055328]